MSKKTKLLLIIALIISIIFAHDVYSYIVYGVDKKSLLFGDSREALFMLINEGVMFLIAVWIFITKYKKDKAARKE